jgi:hypothetical protein
LVETVPVWMLLDFVLRVDEPVSFGFVGGAEGGLFPGVGVFAVENTPAPAEEAVRGFMFEFMC